MAEKYIDPYLIPFDTHIDDRGSLSVLEYPDLPFLVKRIFFLSASKNQTVRGEHGHFETWQGVVAINGTISVLIRNTTIEVNFEIDDTVMLIIPPNNWAKFEFPNKSTKLMVVASDIYKKEDYYI